MPLRIGLLTIAVIILTACGHTAAPQPESNLTHHPALSEKTPSLQPAHDPTTGMDLHRSPRARREAERTCG